MLSAYVLIETEVGKVAHVAQAITKLDGVQLAEDLAGPYDVVGARDRRRLRPRRFAPVRLDSARRGPGGRRTSP